MMRPMRTARLAVVAAASALVLASCAQDTTTGTGSGDTTTPDTTESSSSGSTPSSSAASSSAAPKPSGDGTFVIGELLPSTGDLAFVGPPEFAGVDVAIKDINSAGGVLGKPVKTVAADSGDGTPNIAPTSVDKLLNQKSDVIVGAASSSVSLSVIDKIISDGVVEISPANTSTVFDTYKDKGLYFRTAPSDVLQGAVMSNLVVGDGYKNIAILARQDSYGEGLADQVAKGIEAGGATVATKTLYSADASNFTAEVNKVAATNPDAIVLIAFEETTKIIPTMIAKGIGPADLQVYMTDGGTADYSKAFDPGTLEGVKATYPGAELTGDFKQRMLQEDPKLTEFTYGEEAYDATILSALAATAAKDDAGTSIASQLVAVSGEGEKCTTYADCVKLLDAGKDIDYDGVSGPIDFNDTGSPSKATIGIYKYEADNKFPPNIDYIEGAI